MRIAKTCRDDEKGSLRAAARAVFVSRLRKFAPVWIRASALRFFVPLFVTICRPVSCRGERDQREGIAHGGVAAAEDLGHRDSAATGRWSSVP